MPEVREGAFVLFPWGGWIALFQMHLHKNQEGHLRRDIRMHRGVLVLITSNGSV